MTGPDNVVPLPRPAAADLPDRVNLAAAITNQRPWCPACRPHADDLARALAGDNIQDIADRGGR
jgi:hypothetical protein